MESLLPAATRVDAIAAMLSLAVYLTVGAGAVLAAARDIRARLFLVVAVSNIAPYALTIASWRGAVILDLPRWFVSALLLSLGVGTVALFHFTQVFPRRRPWIHTYRPWLLAMYPAAAVPAAGIFAWTPADVLDPSFAYVAAGLVVGVPWLFGVLVALPFAGLFSLWKSRQDAARAGARPARITTTWMLVSQLGGGVLAVIVIPLLRAAVAASALITAASILLAACGLLMPLAFAAAVWRYRLLR